MDINQRDTGIYLDDIPQENIEESSFLIHKKIAEAMEEEILTGDPCGIALVGKWGSGKSTVLNYLKHLLPDSHHIFTFDTWSHGGDTLRKTFLLSLGDDVLAKKGAPEKDWKDLRRKIEGTESIETKMEQPQFTPVAASFISFAFFYAFFLGVLVLFEEHLPLPPSALAIGISSVLMPICVVLLIRAQKKRYGDSPANDDNDQTAVESFLSYALGKPSLSYQQIIKRSPEIDSVMFVDFFTQIMTKAKTAGTSIVIAIDNLDRLSIEDRENVWEAMQIFLGPEIEKEARPWVILPYSPELYTGRNENKNFGKAAGTISKLFIRQFDLPEPIVSDWKECFIGLFKEAFPSTIHYTALTVFAIADNAGTNRVYRTPREAKRFINDMVSISRIHNTIELASIALFCQLKDRYYSDEDAKDSITDFMIKVISREDSASSLLILKHLEDVEQCLSELAMITFGVFSAEKAEEAYLSYQINRAVDSDQAIPVSKLVYNKPGAWNVIYDQIFSKARDVSARELNKTKWIPETLREMVDYSPHVPNEETEKNKVIKLLCSNFHLCNWPPYDGCADDLQFIFNNNLISASTARRLYDHFINSLKPIAESLENDSSGIASSQLAIWLDETSTVFVSLDKFGAIPGSIELPSLGSSYGLLLEYLYRCEPTDNKFNWLANTSENSPESYYSAMTTYLELLNEDGVLNLLWQSMSLLPSITIMPDNNSHDYSSRENFSIATDQEAIEMYYACWQLLYLGKIDSEKAQDFVASFAMQPAFVNTINQNFKTLTNIEISILVDMALENSGTSWANSLTSMLTSLELDTAIIGEHYSTAFGSQAAARLMKHREEEQVWPLAKSIFQKVFTSADLLENPIDLCIEMVKLSGSRDKMKEFGRFLGKNNRGTDVTTIPFSTELMPVYRGVELESDAGSDFTSWLIGELKLISEDQWKEILRKTGSSFEVNLVLSICRHPTCDLPEALKSAVKITLSTGSFRADQMSKLVSQIGISEVSNYIYHSFSTGHTWWTTVVERIGQTLIALNWMDMISSTQRFHIVRTIVLSGKANASKWLVESLKKDGHAKVRLEGHVQKTRDLLKHRLGLKAPTKGAKEAWVEILNEIA